MSFHCFITVEQSSLRLGHFFLPEDFFKGGLKLSYSSACSTDGTGNVFMLIIHVFQCLEVRCVWLLATCGYCIMSPTPASFSPAFAAELWITVLVRGGGRTGSVCAQGFPKGNTQAPSLCCISQNTECCTSEHGEQSIPMRMKAAGYAKLLGYAKLVMRGRSTLFSYSVGSYVWLESVRAAFDWELPWMSGGKSVE